ncbi:PAS domain S-box protein [Sulfobacillus harzensis]|uniref:PAS domain S-box protein n=1 Tax=Sulfobacillus harzensis TaxID=2729629 RepID=A0A7Y0L6Z9_9FIRM|nr:PAS domain S-box protein [Sulfobacillus harzensis]NMP24385.1 PAS domain S-box protein [Sulfobacillus harzensis]
MSQNLVFGEPSKDLYHSLIEYNPDAVFVLSTDGIVVEANPVVSEILGYAKKDVVGIHFQDLVVSEYREVANQQLDMVGSQRLSRWLDRLNDPADQTETLEHRINACRQKGRYAFEDDYYLREALTYEPVLVTAGLALLLALYRAQSPRLLARIAIPTLLVYSTRPSQPSKVQRQVEQSVQWVLRRNPHIGAIGVNGGHYVHWVDASVVGSVADHIRSTS